MKVNPIREQVQFLKRDEVYDIRSKQSEIFTSAIKTLEENSYDLASLNKKQNLSLVSIFTDSEMEKITQRFHYQSTTINAKGHCDLCGTALVYEFKFKNSVTDKILIIGSECVTKYKVRVAGYNTIEDIKRFVDGETARLSVIHRWNLFTASPEYKEMQNAKSFYSELENIFGLINRIENIKWNDPTSPKYDAERMAENYVGKFVTDNRYDYPTIWNNNYDARNGEYRIIRDKILAQFPSCEENKIVPVKIPVKRGGLMFNIPLFFNSISVYLKKDEMKKQMEALLSKFVNEADVLYNVKRGVREFGYLADSVERSHDYAKIGKIKKYIRFYMWNKVNINKMVTAIKHYNNNVAVFVKKACDETELKLATAKQERDNLMRIEMVEFEKAVAVIKKREEERIAKISIPAPVAKPVDNGYVLTLGTTIVNAEGKSFIWVKKHETLKAILIGRQFGATPPKFGGIWLPKSQTKVNGNQITIPKWLVAQTGIEGVVEND